jgi:6-phosphogluconate dehydrogenase
MGYSLTVGGPEHVFRDLLPLFQALSPQDSKGFAHVGQQGAGHFAKMVHNGIEYGLMQAYSEGFDLLHSNPLFDFDLEQVAGVWNSSSVIRSWLLELTQVTLKENPSMVNVLPYVQDSGEGRWAVEEAVRSGIPVPVMYSALQSRFQSQNTDSFSFKLLACMRQQFGGHPASSR